MLPASFILKVYFFIYQNTNRSTVHTNWAHGQSSSLHGIAKNDKWKLGKNLNFSLTNHVHAAAHTTPSVTSFGRKTNFYFGTSALFNSSVFFYFVLS